MLTPLDIENKKFSKQMMNGYSVNEVDEFLDELTADYEKLYKETTDSKNKIADMQEEMAKYKNIESTLNNTLIMAQTAAEDVKNLAKQQADNILSEAQANAKQAVTELEQEIALKQKELEDLQKQFDVYKAKMESLLISQLELLKEVKEVKRARLTEYAAARKSAEYHEGRGVWQIKCDIALPCATQNELLIDDAKQLVANGCKAVCEGANMPTTLDATKYLQDNGVWFICGKASNAGGVATSALEMSQNSERLSWTFEEVDAKLKQIMVNIYHNIDDAAKRYNMEGNYVAGANIAGFEKVAEAMLAQGVC